MSLDRDVVIRLIKERSEARKSGDFARADGIRAELESNGYVLRDRFDGATGVLIKDGNGWLSRWGEVRT